MDQEVIEVLYNRCYGGWKISEKAMELYKARNGIYNSMELESVDLCRSDPILIQIYNELGDEFSIGCSNIKIKKISKKYEKYYYITEYDGLESLEIDYAQYKVDTICYKITEILQSTNPNDIKLNQIEEFISTCIPLNH
jgi:hypothetical protein